MATSRAAGSNALLVQAPLTSAGDTTLSHRLLRHVLLAVVLLAALLVAIVGGSTAEAETPFSPVQVSAVSDGTAAAAPNGPAVTLR